MSFTIEADALNNRARELVLAGEWPEAQRFLTRCLPGLPVEGAYRIMSGETRLVNLGPQEVDFAENAGQEPREEDLAYRRTLESRYAGVVKTKFGYYQPYAYVSNCGSEDVDTGDKHPGTRGRYLDRHQAQIPLDRKTAGTSNALKRSYILRPFHYADDVDEDIIFDLSVHGVPGFETHILPNAPVLFRRIDGELPPWKEATRDPLEALRAWTAAGLRCEERGNAQTYGIRWVNPLPSSEMTDQDVLQRREADLIAQQEAEVRRRRECEAARLKIVEQANAQGERGWMALEVGAEVLRIPRAPFEHWALDRCGAGHLAPPWSVCSRAGLKMGMTDSALPADDPLHTDWMLGAGLDPLTINWYGADRNGDLGALSLREAAYALMRRIQAENLNFACNVLCGSRIVSGTAYIANAKRKDLPYAGDVVVLPDASERWMEVVQAACGSGSGAVIVAKGGAMAHLVVNGLGDNVNIVRVENATRIYVDGQQIPVDCANGAVTVAAIDLDVAREVDLADPAEEEVEPPSP